MPRTSTLLRSRTLFFARRLVDHPRTTTETLEEQLANFTVTRNTVSITKPRTNDRSQASATWHTLCNTQTLPLLKLKINEIIVNLPLPLPRAAFNKRILIIAKVTRIICFSFAPKFQSTKPRPLFLFFQFHIRGRIPRRKGESYLLGLSCFPLQVTILFIHPPPPPRSFSLSSCIHGVFPSRGKVHPVASN